MTNLAFSSKDFVHLHLHTDYSLLQSTIQLNPLADVLKTHEAKACAITDYANMYGTVSFYMTMRKAGIRPIIGYEANIASGSRFDRSASVRSGERPYYHLVLLAASNTGYQNLVYLSSKAFTEGLNHKPRIDMELLAQHSEGLIGLSAGMAGSVWNALRAGDVEKATANAKEFEDIFGKGRFFLEIQDHGDPEEGTLTKQTAKLSKATGIPLVATNDAHYLTEDDARAQEILICIGEGRIAGDAASQSSNATKYYVRSPEEMWKIFGGDFPEALTNTLKIAEMCDVHLAIEDDNLTLPEFPIPVSSTAGSADEYCRDVVLEGFEKRKREILLPMQEAGTLKYGLDVYEQRLETELGIIKQMGYSGYFLIVWDFIKYAVNKKIPVGPGRGSAAGSLVAYCMEITGIDPIQYDLLFERFLNPERVSMPDIDIDFCIRGRGEVISHVTEFYGRDSVCQIITFGTMASKASIKDVGRALNMPYSDVERIAKMIPPPFRGRNTSIATALKEVPELAAAIASDPKVRELIDLAKRIEGCARHTSVHAAGVVISPKPLHEIVPVAISSKNELTSQYPMGDLEKVGMLKMDFLGLTTLTIIDDCLTALREKAGVEIDWTAVPLNDEKTMKLFSDGKTEAVFQFESSGMQEICRQMGPRELEDLSALNALYRPGPLDGGMIPDFIARFRGEKKVQYLIPEMESVLKNTYGVLVYQEQIMQLAQKLAGYSLGDADLMRRAMGKKDRAKMEVHERKFIDGAVERGIAEMKAKEIFELMNKFADYGFNRSHSIAYAYLAFQTAYLKAHYPAYFYAAVLSHESDDSAKVYKYSTELRSIGLELRPPDINESDDSFTPSDGAVRFGLNAIKGIGSASVGVMLEARKAGKFTSLFDFVSRLDQGAFGRRGLESLVSAGAFDSLKPEEMETALWRAKLFAGIEPALAFGQRAANDRANGQSGLFGEVASSDVSGDELPDVEPWTRSELSRREKAAIGFYLSVHPLDNFLETIAELKILPLADHESVNAGDRLTLAGSISGFQARQSKKGNRFCIFRLEDRSSGLKCLMWAEAYAKFGEILKDDELVIVGGRVESVDGNEVTLIVDDAQLLADAMPKNSRSVQIFLPPNGNDLTVYEEIFSLLSTDRGQCEVFVNLAIDDISVELESPNLRIRGSGKIARELESRGCKVEWRL